MNERKTSDDQTKLNDPKRNPDPITKAPGSHPVGTGIGAAAGGAAGVGAAIAAGDFILQFFYKCAEAFTSAYLRKNALLALRQDCAFKIRIK